MGPWQRRQQRRQWRPRLLLPLLLPRRRRKKQRWKRPTERERERKLVVNRLGSAEGGGVRCRVRFERRWRRTNGVLGWTTFRAARSLT